MSKMVNVYFNVVNALVICYHTPPINGSEGGGQPVVP